MTLPISKNLPEIPNNIAQDPNSLNKYLRRLKYDLEEIYFDISEQVNGTIKNNFAFANDQYLPTVSGSTSAGLGTYSANRQIGWVLRQGVLVDVWFDINWTAHTGTGTMQVDLPYLCSMSNQFPFQAVISAENITFSGYLTGTVLPNTRILQIQDNRSATTINGIAVTNADTTLRGHVRYIGQEIERS